MWSGERLTKFKQLPDLRMCGPKYGEKQEEANEKPKLDNPRRTRGISFIDPEDGELEETIKNAKPSSVQETEAKSCESTKIPKREHACIVEAHESTRQRLKSSLLKDHEESHSLSTAAFASGIFIARGMGINS